MYFLCQTKLYGCNYDDRCIAVRETTRPIWKKRIYLKDKAKEVQFCSLRTKLEILNEARNIE